MKNKELSIMKVISWLIVILISCIWMLYYMAIGIIATLSYLLPKFNYDTADNIVNATHTMTICKALHEYGMITDEEFEEEKDIYKNSEPEAIIGYRYIMLIPLLAMFYNKSCRLVSKFMFYNIWYNEIDNYETNLGYVFLKYIGRGLIRQRNFVIWLADIGVLKWTHAVMCIGGAVILLTNSLHLAFPYGFFYLFLILHLENITNGYDLNRDFKGLTKFLVIHTAGQVFFIASVLFSYFYYNYGWKEVMLGILPLQVIVQSFIFAYIHEMGHNMKLGWNRILYWILSIVVLFPFFRDTHITHHKLYLTKPLQDECISHKNQSIKCYMMYQYLYILKCMWNISRVQTISFVIFQITLLSVMIYFGVEALYLAMGYSMFIAMWQLYSSNYIQHYTLVEEPPEHRSWDTVNLFNNEAYMDLGCHSIHHNQHIKTKERFISKYKLNIGIATQIFMVQIFTRFYFNYIEDVKLRIAEQNNPSVI